MRRREGGEIDVLRSKNFERHRASSKSKFDGELDDLNYDRIKHSAMIKLYEEYKAEEGGGDGAEGGDF